MAAPSPDDAILFLTREMRDVEVRPFAAGEAAVLSHPSPEAKGPNQDAAALVPFDAESGILVVADGVGGQRGGTLAASIALHELHAALEQAAAGGGSLREAVLDGIENANREILALGLGAASTIAIAEVANGRLRPYHVGDSGILALGGRGRVKLQTTFHSPTGYGVESGLLDEKQALRHADRHVVSNVLGSPEMWIEVGSPIEVSARDTVLLATDGLFDNLRTEEIAEILCQGPLADAAAALAERALARMRGPTERRPAKPDDLTIVVWRRAEPGAEEE